MTRTGRWSIRFWVDGGMLGHQNPSPEGVYWSVFCQPPGQVVLRGRSAKHHTNNEAEWLAVRGALQYAKVRFPNHHIRIYSDSMLIVKQFSGVWRCKVARLYILMYECRTLATSFPKCKVQWRPREQMLNRLGH